MTKTFEEGEKTLKITEAILKVVNDEGGNVDTPTMVGDALVVALTLYAQATDWALPDVLTAIEVCWQDAKEKPLHQ